MTIQNRGWFTAGLFALVGGAFASEAHAQTFDPLGFVDADEPETFAHAISGDGSTVVGYSGLGSSNVPFRWTESGGISEISASAGGATAVNSNGTAIAGYLGLPGYSNEHQAFRWTQDGLDMLGYLGTNFTRSMALGISGDGGTVVGKSLIDATADYAAFVWTEAAGMTALDMLADHEGSVASGIAGTKIVGVSYDRSDFLHGLFYDLGTATLWDNGTPVGLESLAPDVFDLGLARAISADGQVIVGTSANGDGNVEAVRWVGGSVHGLGHLTDDGFLSEALDVSGDGSIIVGYTQGNVGGETAFRWIEDEGMRAIGDVLADAGVDHGFYRLQKATGVSDDGRTIVGTGIQLSEDSSYIYASWIMRDNAFTGVNEAAQSLVSTAQIGQGAQSFLGGILDQHQEYVLQHAAGTHVSSYEPMSYAADLGASFPHIRKRIPDAPRWRAFGYAEGYGHSDPDGGYGLGQLGLSYALDRDLIFGGALGFGGSATNMAFDGKADFLGLSGSVFAAYVPETGFQAIVSATAAGMRADIERGYLNGTAPDSSEGETDGAGYGASLRVGYAFDLAATTKVTPFADYQITHVRLDGYTETTGPFPAEISDIDDTANVLKLGAEARQNLTHATWLWASAAWAHRFEDETGGVDAQLIGLFGISGATLPLDQDWGEFTGGISYGFDDGASRLTASATVYVPGGKDVSAGGRIGYSRAF